MVCAHVVAKKQQEQASGSEDFWGTSPSVWDHPEPNYLVSGGILEFWSTVTVIPLAGYLLVYQGLRFRCSAKVMVVYAACVGMYTSAFLAHMTLHRRVFATTVTGVMSNALITFAQFSFVVSKPLESLLLRVAIVTVAFAALVGTVATLPYFLAEKGLPGGVWTLFIVQSPGVWLAAAIAIVLGRMSKTSQERETYSLLTVSGSLLSTAMVLSCIECMIGFDYGCIDALWGFPWLHITIHTLEQVGIYIFGVGVGALEAKLITPVRRDAEVRYVGSWIPYLYCPYQRDKEPPAKPALVEVVDREAVENGGKAVADMPKAPNGNMPTTTRRRRVESPAPVVKKLEVDVREACEDRKSASG
eukprot:TRINITY_DN34618_c0_g1_i1.p1 TRINITY_DN34618_c0_g1~~TRINITY_DN34618_c0_g1_i1.p1  ORF type:complete len:418 (+),score=74.24 TRINITY_DN34618_c0_g1_i1:179-1255(+)